MPFKILIVDDEPHIRSSLAGLLKDQGYKVLSCETGEHALELIKDEYADLVFLDVRLPGIDGLQVLERLKQMVSDVTVIMISGNADLSIAVQATKLGAYNFLEKPLNPEKVLLEANNIVENKKMRNEVVSLKKLVGQEYKLIGDSEIMQRLRRDIRKAAPSDGRILIYGENGTGKELVAREIHELSDRRDKPFVKVNCAAIPKELIESELFGYERGAFTGANKRKLGMIEEANEGTLFLDEIGDMALETQAKLLRVLQENEFRRVGGTTPIKFDVRIISATNKNLTKEIEAGNFREDLYFRLNVIPIEVAPLRERKNDIPLLAQHFIQSYSSQNNKKPKSISKSAFPLLMEYHWRGNIRELKNLIERLVIMTEDDEISYETVFRYLPTSTKIAPREMTPSHENQSLRSLLENFERQLLLQEFQKSEGNVSRMAATLKTDRPNLHRKLKKYHIK
ncbi:response regulator [candidate division KSB1 bacterium]|nr:response regulator [candidate division KSB1 bacterium]